MSKKWVVAYTPAAKKDIKKLDKPQQKIITSWIEKNLIGCENPRSKGTSLVGTTQWRYRVGTYRIICDIQDNRIVILVLNVKHRSIAYRKTNTKKNKRSKK